MRDLITWSSSHTTTVISIQLEMYTVRDVHSKRCTQMSLAAGREYKVVFICLPVIIIHEKKKC